MLREQKGLTQAQLATLTSKSVETISNFERATVKPGLVALEMLARKLDCSVRDFFDDAGVVSTNSDHSDAAKTVLNALELLPEEDVELLAGMAELLTKRRN